VQNLRCKKAGSLIISPTCLIVGRRPYYRVQMSYRAIL